MKNIDKDTKLKNHVDEEVKNIVSDMKDMRTNSKNIILVFFNYLKVDRMYFLTFLITLTFLCFNFTKNIDFNVEDKKIDSLVHAIDVPEVVELNILDYVGIFSRTIKLDVPVKINDVCVLDSYKIVYQVKRDNSINKYFYNSCVGSYLITSETLDYIYDGTNKFIGTEYHSYLFGTNSIREVDGYTYSIDDDLFSIKENIKFDDIDIQFFGDNVVFVTNDDLILSSDNNIYSVSSNYASNGGNLNKRFYVSKNKHQYNFIVFNNFDPISCSSDIVADALGYTIYSIRYDVNSNNFLEPKEVVSRTKSDGCLNYLEDLKRLEE